MNSKYLISFLFCALVKENRAQDIERAGKEAKDILKHEPVSMTGSIGANAVYYRPDGIVARRDPFYWKMTANINISLFNKISLPFTAVITQQDKNYSSNGLDKFSQPFNQFGVSPHYKWLTVHAGFRSVEFSEYTLSGAMFLGGGVDIKPEKSWVSGAAVFGRFVKAIPQGGVDGVVVSLPAYERWGGATRLRIGTPTNNAEIIFLKIQDNINSLSFDTALTVKPQENEVMGLGLSQQINNWCNATGEFSFSMFTKNIYESITPLDGFTYLNQIYSPRPSSQFNKAITMALNFNPERTKFGLKFKRIDPDYKTLGSVFLTNDIEEISLNNSCAFLENKITLSAAAGLQQNNLDKVQVLTSRRAIASVNISYNITPQLNFTGNYSNFSSNTLPVRDVVYDTVRLAQLTQNAGLMCAFAFERKEIKQSLSNTSTYQECGGNQQDQTTFFNETICHSILIAGTGLSLTSSLIYNRATVESNGLNEGFGPNLGIGKTLYRSKIRTTVNFGFQNTFLDAKTISRNYSSLVGLNCTIGRGQSLKLDCSFIKRRSYSPMAPTFTELRVNLGYTCTFAMKSKAIKNKT